MPFDEGSPLIAVVFPTPNGAFDRDSNGLVDLEVAFSDSLRGVDPASIAIRADHAVHGPAGTGNLLPFWRVVRADSTGLVVEETVDNLLPRGTVHLTVTVRDRAGNLAQRSLTLDLPPAALHSILDVHAEHKFNTGQVTIGPDGKKAYVTIEEFGGTDVAVVDLATLTWERNVHSPIPALSETVVDAGRGLLYLVSIDHPVVAVFDLASESFVGEIPISSRGIGAVMSVNRDELYVALEVEGPENGFISVVDLAARREDHVIDLHLPDILDPGATLGINQLVLDPSETTLYGITFRDVGDGIIVVDPVVGALLRQIDLRAEEPRHFGGGFDLHWDQGDLVATTVDQNGIGQVVRIMPADSIPYRTGITQFGLTPKDLAIAPDHRDWAITMGDNGADFIAVMLMDAAAMQIEWEYRQPPTAVSPQGIAFRPDGNVFLTIGGREDRITTASPAELFVFLRR